MSVEDMTILQLQDQLSTEGANGYYEAWDELVRRDKARVELIAQLADAKRNEEVSELKLEHRDGDSYLVWHDGVWKCAHYEDGVGVWVGWYVTGGDNQRPMKPAPVRYRPLPTALDGEI